MGGFVLPQAPEHLRDKPVRAWSEPVTIPTYEPLPPDKNPMFLEKRVYQGSSGKVYPLPFIDRISTEKKDRAWQAIHIENEYVRLMILPELGGRIHVGLDKTNNYDFFYRQNVIKPALVGLAGPWISGGVEFNWPQHHRPSTFMPVDTHIEEHADGSVTVWCSEHEPMNRMKGTHGIHLKPGSSLIELKVRLYNRTELPQTFLWWANVAARVHEQYQSFFPPDVQYVADHAKRAMSRFPLCDGKYYGVDYAARAKEQEAGSKKQEDGIEFPPGGYPRNDLSWYANIPVPTSYMILGTKEDFFGGYDHHAQAGFVHVADHRIAPGKKQWTWGNHPFGYAWDRNLTDPDDPNDPSPPYRKNLPAPYIELMAGVFTDNQPDFSYLMPGEKREFSQYWYPIQQIGPAHFANRSGAFSLQIAHDGKSARIGVSVTSAVENGRVWLMRKEEVLFDSLSEAHSIAPGKPFIRSVQLPADIDPTQLTLILGGSRKNAAGEEQRWRKLVWEPKRVPAKEIPEPAREAELPEFVQNVDDLYLIGLHLEQYRHATRLPELYWMEALRRDPGNSRCNNAIGLWHLRRGEFGKAVACFEKAITTLTKYNPNPRDGEPFYNLGIALAHLNRYDEAIDALSKACWNHCWKDAANRALLIINRRGGQNAGLGAGWPNLSFSMLLAFHAMALTPADAGLQEIRDSIRKDAQKNDSTDHGVRFLLTDQVPDDLQICLDTALDCMKLSHFDVAIRLLTSFGKVRDNNFPLVQYYLAYAYDLSANAAAATEARRAAALASPDYCFPHRLEEIAILLDAITKNPDDPRAPYYLGNLLYDKRRHEEAITWWEKSAKLDGTFPTVWRNLGLAYFNIFHDKLAAKGAYQRALKNSLSWTNGTSHDDAEVSDALPEGPDTSDTQDSSLKTQDSPPGDARILYERDQLWKRCGDLPQARLDELEKYPGLVQQRDDLTVEHCTLLNQLDRPEEALAILRARHFQPWEGGEGMALAQWARTHLILGRKKLWLAPSAGGSPKDALAHFLAALNPPENLGETWHFLQNNSELHYWAGVAAKSLKDDAAARRHFEIAAASAGDFQGMSVRAFSEASYWTGQALRQLGRNAEARAHFEAMLAYAEELKSSKAKIDYFATSLPTMLIFHEDIEETKNQQATLIEVVARHGINGQSGADRKIARRLLNDLLATNPSHALAADLLIALDWDL